ncbi:MAG: TerC/Alx family metal homeostasis membrane protein [bacterium]|nr:TerC/Alx family metal homeostasis membrane protein [bacterium]
MFEVEQIWWLAFVVIVTSLLVLDLGVFNRKAHVVKFKEAVIWTGIWISSAVLFNLGVWVFLGFEAALQFSAAYVIEKSLSIDNLFVFLLIFSHFKIPPIYQHRVLFWGILSAIVLRGIMIYFGLVLIVKFSWITYVFGVIVLLSALRLFLHKNKKSEEENIFLGKLFTRKYNSASSEIGSFFVRRNGKLYATKLLWVLFTIELTDLVFAVDSIPAVLAVSQDAFIVYSSNVFAVLGLRSMYFALSGSYQKFYYLKHGLFLILGFVGIKMILSGLFHIPILVSLIVVISIVVLAVLISFIFPHTDFSDKI